jgi:outer membrane usher protein
VTFRDVKGDVLPLASSGNTGHDTDDFIVGYDGQALLEALGPHNSVTISLPDGSSCRADFDYAARGGDLVDIPDVVCRPQS